MLGSLQYGPEAYLFALERYKENELEDIINKRFSEAFKIGYNDHKVYWFLSPNFKTYI